MEAIKAELFHKYVNKYSFCNKLDRMRYLFKIEPWHYFGYRDKHTNKNRKKTKRKMIQLDLIIVSSIPLWLKKQTTKNKSIMASIIRAGYAAASLCSIVFVCRVVIRLWPDYLYHDKLFGQPTLKCTNTSYETKTARYHTQMVSLLMKHFSHRSWDFC